MNDTLPSAAPYAEFPILISKMLLDGCSGCLGDAQAAWDAISTPPLLNFETLGGYLSFMRVSSCKALLIRFLQ